MLIRRVTYTYDDTQQLFTVQLLATGLKSGQQVNSSWTTPAVGIGVVPGAVEAMFDAASDWYALP